LFRIFLIFHPILFVFFFFRFHLFPPAKGNEKGAMQIFVRTLDDRTLTFDVQPDHTINDVKELVEQREGIPIDEQRLTLGGISLNDELTLDECHIEEESTLYVLLDLEGGGKKRKKKSYNTPKKNKHKHKKVKLAVLKYYKVR